MFHSRHNYIVERRPLVFTSVFYSVNLFSARWSCFLQCSVGIHVILTFNEKRFSLLGETKGLRLNTFTFRLRKTTSPIAFTSEGKQAQQAQQSKTKKQQAHTPKHPRNAHILPHSHGTAVLEIEKTLDTSFQHLLFISTLSPCLSTSLFPPLLSSSLASSLSPLHFRFHSFDIFAQPTAGEVFFMHSFVFPRSIAVLCT